MTLHEIRVSEIQPGDLWLYDGGWVVVNAIEVGHPDDRVGIDYINDGTETELAHAWGSEVAVVKREAVDPILAASRDDIAIMAARELIEAYDAPFPAFGDWAARLGEKVDTLRELVREPGE